MFAGVEDVQPLFFFIFPQNLFVMIVPSMTNEQVRKEFLHDFNMLEDRAIGVYPLLRSAMHKRNQNHATETKLWKSPLHNTWMSFYRMDGPDTGVMHVCITMDHRNLLKSLTLMGEGTVADHYIAEYNIHFYKRYNERMKLNLPKPMLIVKHYFKHNFDSDAFTELSATDHPMVHKIFVPVNGGALLGFRYLDKKWFDMKTFVSNEMLRESQLEMVEYLKEYKLESSPDV